jgi:hopanoid biosynthesis associated RND transporter like protein HpnN
MTTPITLLGNGLMTGIVHSLHYPKLLLLFTLLLCSASLHYTFNHLGVNTNTAEMLSPDLAFQKNRHRMEASFPDDSGAILLVVEAQTPEETLQAAHQLAHQLGLQTEQFDSVYIPTDNDFFKQQALLYLETDALELLVDKLTKAQPFIGHLAQNYHLHGLFSIIHQALNQPQNMPMNVEPLLKAINESFKAEIEQQPHHLSWQNLLASDQLNTNSQRTIVIAKPKMNFNEILAAEPALTAARITIKKMMAQMPTLSIRITGEIALEHEELESVTEGAAMAGIVSLILVCSTLWFGLRSIRLLVATLLTLIVGLILTAGFAAVAIGHLNLISIAFAVLYIGLGVDYAIHLCLRYRECRTLGMENIPAIRESIHSIGFSIFLCALTTSLGFLAFIPTDYSGVSELGIISGMGMLIGLVVSLIVLPALLSLFAFKQLKPLPSTHLPHWIVSFPFHFSQPIKIATLLLVIIAATTLTQLTFDSNPINLRDPTSESVSTIKELLTSTQDSPFALSTLTDNLTEAQQLATRLQTLAVVDEAIVLTDLIAENQDEKLVIIETLDLILGHQLNQFKIIEPQTDTRQAIVKFLAQITQLLRTQPNHVAKEALQQLADHLPIFITQADNHPTSAYPALAENILGLLPYTMERLHVSLMATTFGLKDLPPYLTRHWLSDEGLYRILITPAHDQNQLENQQQFVKAVQAIDNTVTGLSVADQASGVAVVNAFIEAFSGALIAIVLLLLLLLRNIKNTLLVVLPLLLAALLTAACNVMLNNPFNFANIIALPLLMGMGVDSGIHIMHRLQIDVNARESLLQTSTARGVFFSSVTTICSFSSLAFTRHIGTASMGLLLALGIFFTLICTLIILPAFSHQRVETR